MTISIVSIISLVLTILLIVTLVILVIRPAPIKQLIRSLYTDIAYDADSNATITDTYTLYRNTSQITTLPKMRREVNVTDPPDTTITNKALIVVFIGGSMLTCNINQIYGVCNLLYEKVAFTHDIVIVKYPVRFKYTVHDSMVAINNTLQQFVHYTNVHALGFSIGTLLAGAFQQKERNKIAAQTMDLPQIGMQFKSIIGVCGVYENIFSTSLLTHLFSFYIMKNTPGIQFYTCYNLELPMFIISSMSDFLLSQTRKFVHEAIAFSNDQSEYIIYKSTSLPHSFVQYINLDEAKEAIQKIANFLRKIQGNP
jgi:acetyl esterase/lipase